MLTPCIGLSVRPMHSVQRMIAISYNRQEGQQQRFNEILTSQCLKQRAWLDSDDRARRQLTADNSWWGVVTRSRRDVITRQRGTANEPAPQCTTYNSPVKKCAPFTIFIFVPKQRPASLEQGSKAAVRGPRAGLKLNKEA